MLFYLSTLLFSVYSHLTGISTCTDPREPGNITFFLATYHSYTGAVAPGTVHIRSPAGDISTFSLDKSRQANPIWNGPLIMTGSEWDANIKSTYNYASDVSCSHFGDKPEGELTFPALNDDERQSCGFDNVLTYYTASLNNAVSGTYTLWLTGTDAILAYYPVADKVTPCEDSELVVDLIIADGLNTCDSLPSQVENGNSVPSQCVNVISGFRCPTTCSNGYYATGYNQCYNGSWLGDFLCYETLPCLSTDVNSVLSNIDLSRVIGILGTGCDYTILNGTQCTLSCVSGYYGSGNIECVNGTFINNGANCSVIIPTPSPTPNPTPEPTPSPTPSPTPEPTPESTSSPPPVKSSRSSEKGFFEKNYHHFIYLGLLLLLLTCSFSMCLCLIILLRKMKKNNQENQRKKQEIAKKLEMRTHSQKNIVVQGDKEDKI